MTKDLTILMKNVFPFSLTKLIVNWQLKAKYFNNNVLILELKYNAMKNVLNQPDLTGICIYCICIYVYLFI